MPSPLVNNPWIGFHHSSPSAQVKLFCFPYAGAGASVFRTWPPLFPPDIEVCGVQYPGREHRLNEVPCTDVRRMTEALATDLSPHLNTPFALFGHSLGALVAYELTRVLRDRRMELPVHLFVSGRQAPHLVSRHVPVHPLSDSQFIARMRQLNAIPAEAVDNSELLSLLLSILRADFTMGESYTWIDGPPLPVPTSVFGGVADSFMTFEDLTAWRNLISAPFGCKYFSGGHLFLHSCRRELIQALIRDLRKSTLAISR